MNARRTGARVVDQSEDTMCFLTPEKRGVKRANYL